ncbi:MAG: Brp/Blh family beta-carotene 15,15'-dioxygenase [Planctomycetota bacterium]
MTTLQGVTSPNPIALASSKGANRTSDGALVPYIPTLACALALTIATIADAEALAPWPWIIALVFIGMPHGAMDWQVHRRTMPFATTRQCIVALRPYILWMFASLILLVVAPVLTCLAFFVLTAVHFGRADIRDLPGGSDLLDRPVGQALAWSRGALVLAIPFSVDPVGAWQPFAIVTGVELLLPPSIAEAFATSVLTVTALSMAVTFALTRPRATSSRRFLIETAAACALLSLTPPLFAVGCYFLFVHAFKHSTRLVRSPSLRLKDEGETVLQGLARLHKAATPFTVPAVICVLAWATLLVAPWAVAIASASIGFYIISTLPHELLDHRAGRLEILRA